MGESLWADLDEWQVQQIEDNLGVNSAQTSLKVQTVRAVILEEVQDWDNDEYWTYPAVAVMGRDALREFGGHGDGGLSFDITYPYLWLAMVTGEQAVATRDAKIIGKRLETLAREISTTFLPADSSGELQQGIMHVGTSHLLQYRRHRMADQTIGNYDHWYIISRLEISFESKV